MTDDPLARLARFPVGLAVVGVAGLWVSILGAIADGPQGSTSGATAIEMGRSLTGGTILIVGAAAWIGALDQRRSAWRAPLVLIAVGAAILPGAAWVAAAAVVLVGWLEHMGRDSGDANPERDASA